jgi:hypothetical protein
VKCAGEVEGEDGAHDCAQREDRPHSFWLPSSTPDASYREAIMNTQGTGAFTRIDEFRRSGCSEDERSIVIDQNCASQNQGLLGGVLLISAASSGSLPRFNRPGRPVERVQPSN